MSRKQIAWWQDWRKASVIEAMGVTLLVVWNDYSISNRGPDLSLIVLSVCLLGIVVQGLALYYIKSIRWRIFIAFTILAHIVVLPYLIFLVGYVR